MRIIRIIEFFHGCSFSEKRTKIYESEEDFQAYLNHFKDLINIQGDSISQVFAFRLYYDDNGNPSPVESVYFKKRVYKPVRELNAPTPILTVNFL